MRIVVGTLYCGENEIEQCRQSILSQTLLPIKHLVFENLPNREAHARLYSAFMEHADVADLFVKVDADMVIAKSDFFEALEREFTAQTNLDHLQIAVHDFFSDRLIEGLNVFRSSCRWNDVIPNGLYIDHGPFNRRKKKMDWEELAPAAIHCPDPGGFQSFHFGVHKGLKVLEALSDKKWSRFSRHWQNIELTWAHSRRNQDQRLVLACLGAELALAGQFNHDMIDFDNDVVRTRFEQVSKWPVIRKKLMLRLLRGSNRRFLPSGLYKKYLVFNFR